MVTIELLTLIHAPIEKCFDLSLDIDVEVRAATKYRIQPVSGVTSGMIGLGERVTWKSRQFGFVVRHTSEITALQKPYFFQDKMIDGMFRSFEHDHFFRDTGCGNIEMKDVLRFAMPFYILGALSERIFVEKRLRALLGVRNETIKQCAEEILKW